MGCELLFRAIPPLRGNREQTEEEENVMKDQLLKVQTRIQILLEDSGQDLIEYALVVALIAFAATVGMGNVANGINTSFSKIASRLASAIT
jgi:pilus assembly protein Flp/PilA